MSKILFLICIIFLINCCAPNSIKTSSNDELNLISTYKGYHYMFGKCDPSKSSEWISYSCFGGECLKKQFKIDREICNKILNPQEKLGEH